MLSKVILRVRPTHLQFGFSTAVQKVEIPEQIKRDPLFFPQITFNEAQEQKFHQTKRLTQILRKKMDVVNVEEALLNKQKIVLHPIRVRHELDNLDYLNSRNEIPLHIYERNGQPHHDLVLHITQVRQLKKTPLFNYRPVFVKVGNEEIRCSIDKIIFAPDKKSYFKVFMSRYIVGEPNIITVELLLPYKPHQGFMKKQITWERESAKLISFNEVNPVQMELDTLRLARNGSITWGDFQNTLPRGLELHPSLKNKLDLEIVKLDVLWSKFEADYQHKWNMHAPEIDKVFIATTDNFDNLEKMREEDIIAVLKAQREKAKPVKEVKKDKVRFSFKDQDKAIKDKLKADLEKRLAEEKVLLVNTPKGKK